MSSTQTGRRRTVALAIVGALGLIAVFGALVAYIVVSGDAEDVVDAEYAVPPGMDAERGIVIGSDGLPVADPAAAGAPVLAVYSDVMCGHCVDFEQLNSADINAARESGAAVVSYRVMPWMGTGYSLRVSNTLATLAAESPEHFVPFHDMLFEHAYELAEIDPAYEDLAALAVEMGVSDAVAASFADETYVDWAMALRESVASDADFRGTPTIRLDGADVVYDLGVNWQNEGEMAALLAGA